VRAMQGVARHAGRKHVSDIRKEDDSGRIKRPTPMTFANHAL
jgi:hypothetical protein